MGGGGLAPILGGGGPAHSFIEVPDESIWLVMELPKGGVKNRFRVAVWFDLRITLQLRALPLTFTDGAIELSPRETSQLRRELKYQGKAISLSRN